MATSPPRARQQGWTRFGLGAFECTVVSDGPLDLDPPAVVFAGQDGTKVDDLLRAAFASPGRMALDQNLLVVDTGAHLVLFESGSGRERAFGQAFFGRGVGRALGNLRASGIDPGQMSHVVLSHLHPDHCWGLVEGGLPNFPRASIAVGADELAHLDDLAKRLRSSDLDPAHRQAIIGARRSLEPYWEANRVRRLADGEEVVPGVTAHAAPGHSPGHMIFRVRSEGETLVVMGDVAHHHVLHLAQPAWSTIYDHDGALAARTRARVFKDAIETRATILAYHSRSPASGTFRSVTAPSGGIPRPSNSPSRRVDGSRRNASGRVTGRNRARAGNRARRRVSHGAGTTPAHERMNPRRLVRLGAGGTRRPTESGTNTRGHP